MMVMVAAASARRSALRWEYRIRFCGFVGMLTATAMLILMPMLMLMLALNLMPVV